MYVVIEWNQAGGFPHLADTEVYESLSDALAARDEHQRRTDAGPRRERYEVFALVALEEIEI